MKKSFYLFFQVLFLVLFVQSLHAQQITGTVTGEDDGLPIPGTTVAIKGTQRAVATDIDGKFSIEAKSSETLIVSSIGYTVQEIPLSDGKTTLTIILKTDDRQLKEVIIAGAMGVNQKQRATNTNVATVSGQEIANTQRGNFLDALQGRVSGLSAYSTSGQLGASTQIQLRGSSSIGNSNSPLFVVDGLPIDNTTLNQGVLVSNGANRSNDYLNRAADLNPNDIESVTVLKGPEAAALYGSQGSSGVILITTKRGSKGGGKITYSNSFSTNSYYRLPTIQNTYERGANGVFQPDASSFFGPALPTNTKAFDNVNAFFGTGHGQNHNLSFEAGSDKLSYRLSANYQKADGIIPNSNLQVLGLRLAGTAKLLDNLDLTNSIGFTNNDINKVGLGDNGVFNNLYLWPFYDDVNNYLNTDGTRRKLQSLSAEYDNPFFNVYKNINRDQTRRTLINVGLTYKATDWLQLIARVGSDAYNTYGNTFTHPETKSGLTTRGNIENFNEVSRLLNGNFLANITKTWGDLSGGLLLGTSVDDRDYQVTSVYGEQLFDPTFNSINNTLPTTQRNKFSQTRQRLLGAFSQLSLSYKNMLYATVSGRNDWSSTLPKANNSYFYPGASLGFVFSELPVFKNFNWLNYGKVRIAYAKSGKDAPAYKVDAALAAQTSTGGGFLYDFFGSNPNLKPEFVTSREIGAEFKLFRNRVRFDVSYFNADRTDQIVTQRLSYGTGFVFGLLNGGSFNVSGWEGQLGLTPVRMKDLDWDLNLIFSKLSTKVLSLPADVPEYYNSDTWAIGNARASAFNSYSFLQNYYSQYNLVANQNGAGSATAIGGYSYLRNNTGAIVISPSTGLPVLNTNFLPIGDRNPDFSIGLQNSISFKGLRLGFLLDIRKGGDVFNGNDYFFFTRGLSTRFADRSVPYIFKGVLRDGKENSANPTVNDIQVTPLTRSDFFTSGFAEADFVEHNINWLRIKDVTLSYALPATLLTKIKPIKGISVYLTATDLYMWTNYTGGDPSSNSTNATTAGVGSWGFDYGKPGLARSIIFGLNVSLQ